MTGRVWLIVVSMAIAGVSNAVRSDAGPIATPAGLNPSDSFRLVFVSSGTRNATSSDIGDYDAFITTLAVNAGLDDYFGEPVTWQALASTSTVAARDRLPADFGSPALYRIDGQQASPSTGQLWGFGVTGFPITVTEAGADIGGVLVWTGSTGFGSALAPLGGPAVTFGASTLSGFGWVAFDSSPASLDEHLYGYSNVLTVPDTGDVPEPASGTLVLIGLATTRAMARRTRSRLP